IILGLTASPGASKKKINSLCENLHIPVENIHIRNRKDEDVKIYLKPMDIYKIGVNLTPLMEDIYQLITLVLEERLIYLSQNGFLKAKGENRFIKIVRKDLLRLNGELSESLNNTEDKTGLYSALSVNAQALKLYHMLELIEQQGLDILLDYLETLYKESRGRNCSKATRVLISDQRVHNIIIELKKNADYSPENLIHPKYSILEKILLKELENQPSSRILVFTKLRSSVKNIEKRLKNVGKVSPIRFVGQATKSSEDKGLSQKRQIEILESFKIGKYNVLISTNVGEEGLDIAECDLVIFYDVVASEIRYIQRKGRTARHREGKVVILYSKNTRDEIYLRIVLNKLKKMDINLKDPNQLNESYKNVSESLESSNNVKKLPQEVENPVNYLSQKAISTNKYQSNLTFFLNTSVTKETSIQLSKYLPLKFGLRKKLNKDNYPYTIVHSDFHIVIHNKVLIQIFNPQEIQIDKLLNEINTFSHKFPSYIIIFDFIDYQEKIKGEKRASKRRYQELGHTHNFQAIGIDIEEELYFIVKSILEAQK
ncbi:MAG: helicase-related protein, partial [Promethearchaeota archaeon]